MGVVYISREEESRAAPLGAVWTTCSVSIFV